MVFWYVFLAVLAVVALIALHVYDSLEKKQIRDALSEDAFIFYKKQPDSYKIIKGNKKSLAIYPFLKEKEWSVSEQNALFKGEPQVLLTKHEDELYSIDIRRTRIHSDYVLMIKIYRPTEALTSKSQDVLLNTMDCDFLVMDGNYNIVYKNKAVDHELAQITNIYDACRNPQVLKAIVSSQVSTRQVISLFINGATRYYDISFCPKVKYSDDQSYWFLLCYDITELTLLKKQVSSKIRILHTLQDGIYELFTCTLLEKGINSILYNIGTNLDVQRSYIYRFYKDKFFLDYEWREVTVEVEGGLYDTIEKDIFLKFIEDKPTEPVVVFKQHVSPERQQIWDQYGITCKVVVPLISRDGKIWGLLGFDCYNDCEHKWTAEQLGLIKLIAVTLNAVIVLDEDGKQITNLNNQIKEILKALTLRINSEIEQAQFINESLRLENKALTRK